MQGVKPLGVTEGNPRGEDGPKGYRRTEARDAKRAVEADVRGFKNIKKVVRTWLKIRSRKRNWIRAR